MAITNALTWESPMARHSSFQADPTRSLFQEADQPGIASSQFWVAIVRYRPVLLVGGFWMLLICLAAVAYSRLMFTGTPPTPADPVVSDAAASAVNGDSERESIDLRGPSPAVKTADPTRNSPFGDSLPAGSDSEAAEVTDSRAVDSSSAATLAWLVGLCALGSLGISYGVRLPKRSQSARKVPSKLPQGQRSLSNRRSGRQIVAQPVKRQPERLSPYSPERDGVLVPARPPQPSPRLQPKPLVRLANKKLPPSTSTVPTSSGRPDPEVTVLSPAERHPLDWPEGSLADSLDLRNRRSLSSLL